MCLLSGLLLIGASCLNKEKEKGFLEVFCLLVLFI